MFIRDVMALFDGASAGILGLKKADVNFENYHRSEIDKYANMVAEKNSPENKNFGDVTNWRNWDVDWSRVDLLIGGSPCFVKDTRVLTEKGYVNINEVEVGDKVLTHNKNWKKVLKVGGEVKVKQEIYYSVNEEAQDKFPIPKIIPPSYLWACGFNLIAEYVAEKWIDDNSYDWEDSLEVYLYEKDDIKSLIGVWKVHIEAELTYDAREIRRV